jgi:hypothetical protein
MKQQLSVQLAGKMEEETLAVVLVLDRLAMFFTQAALVAQDKILSAVAEVVVALLGQTATAWAALMLLL